MRHIVFTFVVNTNTIILCIVIKGGMYMDYLPWVWIGVMVVMAVAEGLTTQLVSVWFVVGALVAAIVSFFVPNLAIQMALFVGVSLFMLIITKPYVQKAKKHQS